MEVFENLFDKKLVVIFFLITLAIALLLLARATELLEGVGAGL